MFSPGGDVFGAFHVGGDDAPVNGKGIAWKVEAPRRVRRIRCSNPIRAAHKIRPRTIRSFAERQAALTAKGKCGPEPF
jgi:hypothetical protein